MGLPAAQLDKTYWFPWYDNVSMGAQLRLGNPGGSPAHVNVYVGGALMSGSPFTILAGSSAKLAFVKVNTGPLKVVSDAPVVAAEALTYKVNGAPASFSEMMGLPAHQLDKGYWLPWYNNAGFRTQLRVANVSGSAAHVSIYIGGSLMPGSPFTVPAGQTSNLAFKKINTGPVHIVSDVQVVVSERVICRVGTTPVSLSETLAMPASRLDTTYWMPWYDSVSVGTSLRLGNTGGSQAHVNVYIGGTLMTGSPFTILPGQTARLAFPGTNTGPVKIVSDLPLVAEEALTYKSNGVVNSFSEMPALPNSQLDSTYWMPRYSNVGSTRTQLRIAIP
jgi:hypothetical protein